MREKIVLIGAGSAMFTRGLVADLLGRGWDTELALVDTDPRALAVAAGLTRKMIAVKGARARVTASTNRRTVLRDATAVICTVGVGGRKAWLKDVTIPRKYGIYQPVGDSVMPGGTSRALRMIPAMVGVARDVLALCPKALFFNYGNPMAPVCRAIRKATGAPVTGLCHGVNDVAHTLAFELGVDFQDLRYTAIGMNHCTWFVDVRVKGHDAMPRMRRIAAHKRYDWFSWQCVTLFGAFPACMDRHVTEFFPQFFREGTYKKHRLGVTEYSLERTIGWGDKIFADMKRDAAGNKPLPADYFDRIGGEHEQVLDIVESIRRGDGKTYSANLPNNGRVPALPRDAILEGPCVATRSGLRAASVPPLSSGLAGTLATRLQWVETVVEAALEGSRTKFVQALVLDGACPSLAVAHRLADDLLRAQRAYLPQFHHGRSS
ncbi:MAG: hypothetical protein AAB152_04550 [Candidatus Coatesbacteria bacterium]